MKNRFEKPAALLSKAFNAVADNLVPLALATFTATAMTSILVKDMRKIEDSLIADNVPVSMRQTVRIKAPADQCDTLRSDLVQACENVRVVMRDQTYMIIYTRDRKKSQIVPDAMP